MSEWPLKRCVFFDRDGIVNEAPASRYVLRWEDFRLQPAFIESLRVVRRCCYEAVIVTNQRCIARGLVDRSVVDMIHFRLRERLRHEYDLDVLDILVCPHDEGQCECRKPKPGLLVEAARRHGIELKCSWMVGDQDRDIEAGRRAGCRTIRVGGGSGTADVEVAVIEDLPGALERALCAQTARLQHKGEKCQ